MLFIPKRHVPERPISGFLPLGRPLKAYILSAYFYPTSKSLGNNSFALVMSVNLGRNRENYIDLQWGGSPDATEIEVLARNRTGGVVMKTHYVRITPHDNCQMVAVFATLQLLPNPISISMVSTEQLTPILFQIPSSVKREVVICISPIYVSEQWQNFLLAVHTYKQFGGYMHLYFISAETSFFELMSEYEKHDFLTIQPWDRIIFPFVPGTVADAYSQVEFQNLAAAQTDCILQYKESAQFVGLFDLNDVLIPKLAPTYIKEFQILLEKNKAEPNIAYLSYERQYYDATVFTKAKYTINDMLRSLVNKKKSDDDPREVDFPNDHLMIFNKHSYFYNNSIAEMEFTRRKMFQKEKISEILPNLPTFYYFYDLVNKCFEERYYDVLKSNNHRNVDNICPGPHICAFYQHPDVNCVHVNAAHKYMDPLDPITYYYATDHYYTADIGCYPQ